MTVVFLVGAACLIVGCATGALLMRRQLGSHLAAAAQVAAGLRAQLDAASAAQVQVVELRAQMSGLRHDLRGILSPALLVADRLIGSEDAAIRRAGDVVVRTVERATARLAESAQAPAAAQISQTPTNIAQR